MRNCTHVLRTVLCLFVCALVATTGFSQQIAKGITASTGDYLGFYEFKPKEYDTEGDVKHPLIIFLHGIGERGNGTTELWKVARIALPQMLRDGWDTKTTWNGKTEKFIVLSPQCPMSYGMWPQAFINDLITYAKTNLRIDPNRIYLTGLSMGGGGSNRYISTSANAPKNLAATATICTPCTFSEGSYVADAKMPYWAYHAADDAVALSSCTDRAVDRINAANPEVKPIRRIWPTGGHEVWDRVYKDTNYKWDNTITVYEWFLGQNKSLPVNKLPVARTAKNITTTTAIGAVTLDASASTDGDGSIVRYVWKKISGPAAGSIKNGFGPNASATVSGLTLAGTYTYELSVVDNRAGFTRDTLVVTVTNDATLPNMAPVAKAGNDITITLPINKVTVNGTGSTDSDGTISSYLWTKISGPSSFSFVNASAATTDINNLVEGTYVFRLKVTDNKSATHEDDITVKVNPAANIPPVAKAGNDITITLPINKVTVNGTSSTDSDGTISSYLWTKISGPASFSFVNASAATTDINNLVEGTYVFRLKVTDNKAATHEDDITVNVKAAPNVAPVAKAGNDITITLPANKVTVDGTGSADSDGAISAYLWTKISGPASFSFVNASAATTDINNLVEGTYVFRLKVTDNKAATHEDDITVKVNPAANIPPVAKAGNDITITLPINKVTVNGTSSTDSDGTISSYLWTKISGPASFSFVNASAATTDINNLVEGTYVFRLKVTDNKAATHEDDITVNVKAAPNVAPVAKAGNDITITLPSNKVTVDGTGSADSDGTISAYLWTKISGPASFSFVNANAATTDINNLVEGTYVFRLKVTDNKSATHEDDITVIVNAAPNVAPVAKAGSDITITLPVNKVSVNGSNSTDNDGTIVTYLWTKISGPSQFIIAKPGSAQTDLTNLVEGTYVFRLKVTDNRGATHADDITIKVNAAPPPPNSAPVAQAGANKTITLPVNTVTVDASGSFDPDGSITQFEWTYLTGPASFAIAQFNSAITEISGLAEGTYTFRLVVRDNRGATDADTIAIKVNAEEEPLPTPNIAPVAKALNNTINITVPQNEIELDATLSSDVDGNIVSFLWTKISGPSQLNIKDRNSAITPVSNLVAGSYTFVVQVKDNDGATATDTVTVIVNPAANMAPVADAGVDMKVYLPDPQIRLDGLDAYDPDGTIESYSWEQTGGEGGVTIINATTSTPGIYGVKAGEYAFTLTVTDNNGLSSSDEVKVLVLPAKDSIVRDSVPDGNLKYEEQLSVFPNPASADIRFKLTSDQKGRASVSIFNMSGMLMHTGIIEKTAAELSQQINIAKLQRGVYYIQINVDGRKTTAKFVKK